MASRDDGKRYRVDILKQSYAVRRRLGREIILRSSQTCVVDGIKEGKSSQVIDELFSCTAINRGDEM
jgi:DNA-binding FrmR family transcriptional regulator